MGIKIKNLASLNVAIERTQSRVDRASLAFVRRAGKIIADQAKLNAPVDTHDLEKAIVTSEKIDTSRNNRKVIEVGVDTDLLDLESREGFDYSLEMHEGEYKLGPGSRAKQSALAGEATVGPKYLERAVDEHEETLRRAAAEIMKGALQ